MLVSTMYVRGCMLRNAPIRVICWWHERWRLAYQKRKRKLYLAETM